MLLMINGWPGVGKLTVARLVAAELGARLLDHHTIFNIAHRLNDFRSPSYYETARAVRGVAFQAAAKIPSGEPIVMTGIWGDSDWGNENWAAVTDLARQRGAKFFVVVLDCSEEENVRRVAQPERAALNKLLDPAALIEARNRPGRALLCRGDAVRRVDNSNLSARECAARIIAWLRSRH